MSVQVIGRRFAISVRVLDVKPLGEMQMIKVPRESFNIARTRVSVEQFNKFLKETRYTARSENSERLLSFIAKSPELYTARWLNFFDVKAFAQWLGNRTGRDLGIPTDMQLKTAWDKGCLKVAKDILSQNIISQDSFDWTMTKLSMTSDEHFLRSSDACIIRPDFMRDGSFTVRLVENLKKRNPA